MTFLRIIWKKLLCYFVLVKNVNFLWKQFCDLFASLGNKLNFKILWELFSYFMAFVILMKAFTAIKLF